jgi:hypothetical protein
MVMVMVVANTKHNFDNDCNMMMVTIGGGGGDESDDDPQKSKPINTKG